MARRMTWEEIKRSYPDEWVLIMDYEADDDGEVSIGTVVRHSRDDKEIFALPPLGESGAFMYTGDGRLKAQVELQEA